MSCLSCMAWESKSSPMVHVKRKPPTATIISVVLLFPLPLAAADAAAAAAATVNADADPASEEDSSWIEAGKGGAAPGTGTMLSFDAACRCVYGKERWLVQSVL